MKRCARTEADGEAPVSKLGTVLLQTAFRAFVLAAGC